MESDLKLMIMPRYDLPDAYTKFNCDFVISILEPSEIENEGGETAQRPEGIHCDAHKKFYFDDTSKPHNNGAPTIQDVESILNLYDQILNKRVFVHCFAGISRSSATVFALYARHYGDGNELLALEKTIDSAPYKGIWPNDLIVQHADELLKRNGKMQEELAKWKATKIKNPIIY